MFTVPNSEILAPRDKGRQRMVENGEPHCCEVDPGLHEHRLIFHGNFSPSGLKRFKKSARWQLFSEPAYGGKPLIRCLGEAPRSVSRGREAGSLILLAGIDKKRNRKEQTE